MRTLLRRGCCGRGAVAIAVRVLATDFYRVCGCGRYVRVAIVRWVCVLLINADGWDALIVVITMAF